MIIICGIHCMTCDVVEASCTCLTELSLAVLFIL